MAGKRRTPDEIKAELNMLLSNHGQLSRIKEFSTKRITLEDGSIFLGNDAVRLYKRICDRDTDSYINNFDKIYVEHNGEIATQLRRDINSKAGKISGGINRTKPWNMCAEYRAALENNEEFYFTGIPCKNGHISKRRISNHVCVDCGKLYHEKYNYYEKDNNSLWKQFKTRKQAAIRKGILFTIKFDEVDQPKYCPVLGFELDYGVGKYKDNKLKRSDNKASIDKVVPGLGYISGNVRVISFRANRLKSDASVTELESIIKYMKDNKNGESN